MEFRKRTENALKAITANGHTHHLHRRWLETLSYLENCGHRKIALYQPPRNASLSLLKHAAEEARHAYFFKRQILKLKLGPPEPGRRLALLGGIKAKNYLHLLDLNISRALKTTAGLRGRMLKDACYLLTTHTVETRAMEVYPIYQRLLQERVSPISLKTILAEEEGHLEEMEQMIGDTDLESFIGPCQRIEKALFAEVLGAIERELGIEDQEGEGEEKEA